MASVPDDYLAAGAAIIERLRQQVPELRDVLTMEDAAQVQESAVASPVAYVAYDGDTLGDGVVRGAPQVVTQRWLVVLAVRSARQQRAATHEAAGPLLSKIIAALAGFTPPPLRRPLRRTTTPRVNYRPGGLTLYPLAWAGELTTT